VAAKIWIQGKITLVIENFRLKIDSFKKKPFANKPVVRITETEVR